MSGADDSELVQHNILLYNTILILLVLADLKFWELTGSSSQRKALLLIPQQSTVSAVHSFDPVCMFLSELNEIYTWLS